MGTSVRAAWVFLALVLGGGIVYRLTKPAGGPPDPRPNRAPSEAKPGGSPIVLAEDFEVPLDPSRWVPTAENDFEERSADVIGGRLRLRCATRGTRDDTVKFLGVRAAEPLPPGQDIRISAELDWNRQPNGSYLSAGVVLAAAETTGNPLATPDFLRVEYVGVPPGRNARLVVAVKNGGREQYLYTEGWPRVRPEGRAIGVQRLEIVLRGDAFEVVENGERIFESSPKAIGFRPAYLHLHMSSHSNYAPREVFFDNVRVVRGAPR